MKEIKPKKRDILIAEIFLLIGFLSSSIFKNTRVDPGHQTAASEITSICIASIEAQEELYETCNERYSTFFNCVNDLDNCDIPAATKKGQEYNDKEIEIGKRIEDQTDKLKILIEKVEGL